jgi:two-component system copper resistance phosphate regulon response regulator CusR
MVRKLLIVDDDPKLRAFLRAGLEESGYSCEASKNAEEALGAIERAGRERFDLILLDVMMPGRSGWDLLQELRETGDRTPVIFLTARHEVSERVKGLQLGADDYVIKPFEFGELLARIETSLRRRRELTTIQVGDLHMDLVHRVVNRASERVELSPKEFEVLHALAENAGRVVSRTELLHTVWGIDFDPGTNLVDVQVANLRRKYDRTGPAMIETVIGEGYRLVPGGTLG